VSERLGKWRERGQELINLQRHGYLAVFTKHHRHAFEAAIVGSSASSSLLIIHGIRRKRAVVGLNKVGWNHSSLARDKNTLGPTAIAASRQQCEDIAFVEAQLATISTHKVTNSDNDFASCHQVRVSVDCVRACVVKAVETGHSGWVERLESDTV
jgi:hypothetical protein